jgi:hypothetical protein
MMMYPNTIKITIMITIPKKFKKKNVIGKRKFVSLSEEVHKVPKGLEDLEVIQDPKGLKERKEKPEKGDQEVMQVV